MFVAGPSAVCGSNCDVWGEVRAVLAVLEGLIVGLRRGCVPALIACSAPDAQNHISRKPSWKQQLQVAQHVAWSVLHDPLLLCP